jgi:hypothetical protein
MIRISAVEYIAGGFDIDYTKRIASMYAAAGVDCIDIVQAGFSTQVPPAIADGCSPRRLCSLCTRRKGAPSLVRL